MYPWGTPASVGIINTMLCQQHQLASAAGTFQPTVGDVASAYQQPIISQGKFLGIWTTSVVPCVTAGRATDTQTPETCGRAITRPLHKRHNSTSELWAPEALVDDAVVAAAHAFSDLPPDFPIRPEAPPPTQVAAARGSALAWSTSSK